MNLSLWKGFIFLIFQLAWVYGDSYGRLDLEKQILQKMFMASKFHMYVRPDKNANQTTDEPLEVFVSLYILNIDVDVKNEECTVQMYFRQEWNDSRLSYDDQGKINVLSLHDAVGLWTPDLFFVNEKMGHLHTLTKPNVFVRINSQGKVMYSQRVTVKFACPMDLRKYPFDAQICTLPIESYGYTANDIMLKWKVDTTFGTMEPQGYQVSYSTIEEIIELAVSNYSRIQLGIHLTRLIHPLLIHVYIPLTLLVAASWFSFFLRPSDSIPRLTALITTVFTTLIFSQSIKEFLYPMSYLTAMDVWVGFSCFLIFATVFENVYVIASYSDKAATTTFPADGISDKKDVPELSNEGKDNRKLIEVLAGKLPDSNVDAIARMTFPSLFVLFNIIYLAYYVI